jgi:hypothetical protein
MDGPCSAHAANVIMCLFDLARIIRYVSLKLRLVRVKGVVFFDLLAMSRIVATRRQSSRGASSYRRLPHVTMKGARGDMVNYHFYRKTAAGP